MSDHTGSNKAHPVWSGLAGAVIAVAFLFWFLQIRSSPARVVALRQCENRYAAARTRLDSLAVDTLQVLQDRSTEVLHETCGALRRAGRLRQDR